jgi:hypothetical protein
LADSQTGFTTKLQRTQQNKCGLRLKASISGELRMKNQLQLRFARQRRMAQGWSHPSQGLGVMVGRERLRGRMLTAEGWSKTAALSIQ